MPLERKVSFLIDILWAFLCIPSFLIQYSATQLVSSLFHPSHRIFALTVVLACFLEGTFIKYQFFNSVLNTDNNYSDFFLYVVTMRLYRIETATLVIPFVFLLPAAYYFIKISPYPQDYAVA